MSEWTTLRNVLNGQLVEFMDGRFGVKVRDNQVQFCRTVETERAGSAFIGPTSMSNTMMERAQVRPVDLGKLVEDERDARIASSESQARPTDLSLPDVLPFFDEQLDVQALLAEVEKAQEQDRPCAGGDPHMIDRLAHVIRTYRGMETRDSSVQSKLCRSTHETGLICSQKLWAHDDGFHYAKSQDGKLYRWADEKGEHARSLGNSLFVQTEGSGGPFWALVKPHAVTLEKMTNETSTWLALAAECDKRIDVGSVAQWFRENGALDELPQKVADEMPRFCKWVVRKVAADMIDAAQKETAREVDIRRDQEKLANEMLDRVESAESALIVFWQDIRTIVGPVEVTDADREAVAEEDAANGPDTREYYAERKALLRTVRENAEGVAELRRYSQAYRTPKQMAMDIIAAVKDNHVSKVRDQFELELSEIRDVLSKAGHTVDTHAQLMGCLLALAGDDPPIEHEEKQPSLWPQFSSFDTRVYMPLLAKLAEMIGQPHEHGQPNMEARQNRIIRLARAVQALATSHGISSTSAAIVDQGSFE